MSEQSKQDRQSGPQPEKPNPWPFVFAGVVGACALGYYFLSARHPSQQRQTASQPSSDPQSSNIQQGSATPNQELSPTHDGAHSNLESRAPGEPSTREPASVRPGGPSAPSAKGDPAPNAAPALPRAATPALPHGATPVAAGCFEEVFVHKKLSSHSDGEACLQHKNLITLNLPQGADGSAINSKSICVRVNDQPVKYTHNISKPNEILLAAVAGPDSVIKVRYCLGKASCAQFKKTCTVAQDDFLTSIGAAGGAGAYDDLSDPAPSAAWDSKSAKQERAAQVQVDRKLAQVKKLFDTARNKHGTFKDWMATSGQFATPIENVCRSKGGS